jgi:hypothetical protein
MKISESTPEGFELGYYQSKFADAAEARLPLADGRQRCSDCAFRQGTYPNGNPITQMVAIKCIMEGVPFNCHQETDKPCVGWALLRRERGPDGIRAPWDFPDEDSR